MNGTTLACFDERENTVSHIPTGIHSKAAGDFLVVFAFAQITFTQIIIKRYVKVMQKQQMVFPVLLHSIEKAVFIL